MRNKIKSIMFIIIFVLMIFIFSKDVFARQELKKLEFDAEIDSSGNMYVTEKWDVLAENTNTLFKTFKLDANRFENVTVLETTNGCIQEYINVNEIQHHVDESGFYALENEFGDFEIAWNIGADNQSLRKQFEISYTVKNVINIYNDCAELYWKFLSDESSTPVDNLYGEIRLPETVYPSEEFRVWAHGPLHGEISREDDRIAKFTVEDLEANTMVEVRIITPIDIYGQSINIINENKLENILAEEEQWATDSNNQREKAKEIVNSYKNGARIISIIITVVGFFGLYYTNNILNTYPKTKPEQEIIYCRTFPDENATPGEVQFLYNFRKKFDTGKVLSATLLDLALKKIIEFEPIPDKKKDVNIIFVNEQDALLLPDDEKAIFDFLKRASHLRKKISMKEFKQYCEKNQEEAVKLWKKIPKLAKWANYHKKNCDMKIEKKGRVISGLIIIWIILSIWSLILISTSKLAIFSLVVSFVNTIMCILAGNRLTGLTEKGINEKEKWGGIKRFMKDFSLLDEKKIPDLLLWEKYLVYATALGIAKDVIKQLKVRFPQLQDEEQLRRNYSFIYYSDHYNVNTSFEMAIFNAYTTKVAKTAASVMSSAAGMGGGFSSGGGGGIGGGSMGGR